MGRAQTEETRKKISEALRGKPGTSGSFKAGADSRRGLLHKPGCLCAAHDPSKRGPGSRVQLADMVALRSRPSGQRLKHCLITAGVKQDICELCGIGPVWNDKPLVLQLDHIDGDETNNAIDNLRVACPNCHSQTETFAGRSAKHLRA